MQIHGVEVFGPDKVSEIYSGQISRKRKYLEYLSADGYYFIANNYQNMDITKKWDENDPIRVASSLIARPRYLWAVKPSPADANVADIRDHVAWR